MSFARYLDLEGRCAVALGVALVVLAAVFGDWDEGVAPAVAIAVVVGGAAAIGGRAATRSALGKAGTSPPRMAADAVRRQTILETVAWVVAVGAWVAATGSSAGVIAGTGAATVVFGVVRWRARVPADVLVDRRVPVIGASATRPS